MHLITLHNDFSAGSVNSIAASRLRIATPRVFLLLMLLLKSVTL